MPELIREAARVAVSLREHVSNQFAIDSDNHAANASHQHFNMWLKDILGILGQRQSSKSTEAPTEAPFQDSNNKFTTLEVEEPSVEFLLSKISIAPNEATGKPRLGKEENMEYALATSDEEKGQAVTCLYADFNDIRRQLSLLWEAYRTGDRDLISVSIATNAAFEKAKLIESELVESYPDLSNTHKIFSFLLWVLFDTAMEPDEKFGESDFCMSNAMHEFLFIQVMRRAETLWNFPPHSWDMAALVEGESLLSGGDKYLHGIRSDPAYDCTALVWIYADVWVMREVGASFDILDAFTEHLYLRDYHKPESLTSVLMHAVMLDIQNVLGSNVTLPFEELRACKQAIEHELGPLPVRGDQEPNPLEQNLKTALQRISSVVDQDWISTQARKIPVDQRKVIEQRIRWNALPRARQRLFKLHPLLCGTMLWSVQLAYSQMSLEIANVSKSILASVHLHNALQQTKSLRSDALWTDLEYIIETHSREEFFLGSRPTNLADMIHSWELANGLPPSSNSKESLALFKRDPKQAMLARRNVTRRDPKKLNSPFPLSLAIYLNFVRDRQFRMFLSEVLKSMARRRYLDQQKDEETGRTEGSERTEKEWNKYYTTEFLALSPGEHVMAIANIFSKSERTALRFDYYAMHKSCSKLLVQMMSVTTTNLDESQQSWLHPELTDFLVSAIFKSEAIVMRVTQQDIYEDHLTNGDIFQRAATIMSAHMADDGALVKQKMLKETMANEKA